jgi:hypothetical protein
MQHTLTGKRVLITRAGEFMGPALCEVTDLCRLSLEGNPARLMVIDDHMALSRGSAGGCRRRHGPVPAQGPERPRGVLGLRRRQAATSGPAGFAPRVRPG